MTRFCRLSSADNIARPGLVNTIIIILFIAQLEMVSILGKETPEKTLLETNSNLSCCSVRGRINRKKKVPDLVLKDFRIRIIIFNTSGLLCVLLKLNDLSAVLQE